MITSCPPTPPPDEHQDEYTFDQLGVRVPALLISPWVDRRVVHTQFDHTSLLKYLIDKWRLRPLTVATVTKQALPARFALVDSRADTPASVIVPPLVAAIHAEALPQGAWQDVTRHELEEPANDLQQSLMVFAKHLEEREVPMSARRVTMAAGPLTEEIRAKQRVLEFLEQQKMKARLDR